MDRDRDAHVPAASDRARDPGGCAREVRVIDGLRAMAARTICAHPGARRAAAALKRRAAQS